MLDNSTKQILAVKHCLSEYLVDANIYAGTTTKKVHLELCSEKEQKLLISSLKHLKHKQLLRYKNARTKFIVEF